MSSVRVVTPSASTFSRVAGSLKRAMPHTSLSAASDRARPNAMRPAGPVIRIFSSCSTSDVVADAGMEMTVWDGAGKGEVESTLFADPHLGAGRLDGVGRIPPVRGLGIAGDDMGAGDAERRIGDVDGDVDGGWTGRG